MKEKRKLLAVILSLAMILTFMPAAAFAGSESGAWLEMDDHGSDKQINFTNEDGAIQAAYLTSDGFIYTRVNSDGLDSVRIVGYKGGGTVINVPEKINGHTVSGFSIDPYEPFDGESYEAIKEINLPDSMIYLRTNNIRYFENLESVGGLKGDLENDRYKTIDGVLYKKTDRGLKAFYPAARKDTKWTMEPGTYSVSLGSEADIEELTYSDVYNGTSLLYELPNLKTINIPKSNTNFSMTDGVLFTADKKELLKYPPKKEGKAYKVPDGTETIGSSSFAGNSFIESLTLNKELTYIDRYAFEGCANLSSVVLSDNIKGISEGAFYGCDKLKTITFTSLKAPECEYPEDYFEGIAEAISAGVEVKYPENGTGYEEFLEALKSESWTFNESDYKAINLGTETDLTIAPGKSGCLKFTAGAARKYELEIQSTEEGDGYSEFFVYSYDVSEGYFDEVGECYVNQGGSDSTNFGMLKGESLYLRINASRSNTFDKIKVTIRDYGPIGLADIPESCETLELGVEKEGSVSSADQVVTYKYVAPLPQNEEDVEEVRLRVSATRTAEDGSDSEFKIVPLRSDQTKYYNWNSIFENSNEIDGYIYLDSGYTYYIQVCPGTVGDFTIMLSTPEQSSGETDSNVFSDVPSGEIESIAVNEEKTVEATGEGETFTYEFVPKKSGNYVFKSAGSSDTVGRVLFGGEELKLNDDGGNGTNFYVTFFAEAGKTYYLQARLYNTSDTATFTVKVIDYIGEHQHKMVYHPVVAGTEEKRGTIAYYECTVCGRIFSDEAGKNELDPENISREYGELITSVSFESKSELTGTVGSKYTKDEKFLEPENKITVKYDNGAVEEYICKEIKYEDESYFRYFLNGDTDGFSINNYISFAVKTDSGKLAEGENTVDLKVTLNGQTVSTPIKVKGIVDSSAHKHTMTKVDAVAATCTADGAKAYWKCSSCGKMFSDESGKTEISKPGRIKATGHTETAIADVAPTCTEKGSKGGKKCSVCGEILEAPQEVAALGHKLTKVDAKEATTDTEGNIEYWTCGTCGKIFSDAEGKTEIDKAKTVLPKKEAPADPAQPTQPTQPTQPAQPSQPTQPTQPSQPTQPETPAAAEPAAETPATAEPVAETPAVKIGTSKNVTSGKVVVTSVKSKTVAFSKAKNKKSVVVPATVTIKGKSYKVTTIKAKAFKGSKIRSVTIGKNVKKISKNAFNGSKATTVTVKTKLLKKASVKGSLSKSKVKTVKVKVGTKKQNKKYVKNYKKIFTKKNAGKKVTVK